MWSKDWNISFKKKQEGMLSHFTFWKSVLLEIDFLILFCVSNAFQSEL